MLLLLPPMVGALALSLAVGGHRVLALFLLPVVLAAGIYLRRFGPAGVRVAPVLFAGYLFGFLLEAPDRRRCSRVADGGDRGGPRGRDHGQDRRIPRKQRTGSAADPAVVCRPGRQAVRAGLDGIRRTGPPDEPPTARPGEPPGSDSPGHRRPARRSQREFHGGPAPPATVRRQGGPGQRGPVHWGAPPVDSPAGPSASGCARSSRTWRPGRPGRARAVAEALARHAATSGDNARQTVVHRLAGSVVNFTGAMSQWLELGTQDYSRGDPPLFTSQVPLRPGGPPRAAAATDQASSNTEPGRLLPRAASLPTPAPRSRWRGHRGGHRSGRRPVRGALLLGGDRCLRRLPGNQQHGGADRQGLLPGGWHPGGHPGRFRTGEPHRDACGLDDRGDPGLGVAGPVPATRGLRVPGCGCHRDGVPAVRGVRGVQQRAARRAARGDRHRRRGSRRHRCSSCCPCTPPGWPGPPCRATSRSWPGCSSGQPSARPPTRPWRMAIPGHWTPPTRHWCPPPRRCGPSRSAANGSPPPSLPPRHPVGTRSTWSATSRGPPSRDAETAALRGTGARNPASIAHLGPVRRPRIAPGHLHPLRLPV